MTASTRVGRRGWIEAVLWPSTPTALARLVLLRLWLAPVQGYRLIPSHHVARP